MTPAKPLSSGPKVGRHSPVQARLASESLSRGVKVADYSVATSPHARHPRMHQVDGRCVCRKSRTITGQG